MKAGHFLAALTLVFGIGQQAVAQDIKPPEAQQEVQQAPVAEKAMEPSAAIQDKSAADAQSVASSASPAAGAAATPAAREATPSGPAQATSWLDSFLYEVKITDVLVALFAGLLVLLGSIQARRMREAVHAARESAGVAEKSARVAEDALISGQRAFMFIREIKTFLNQDPETGRYHWTIHPVWANSGNTPTRGLSINTTYRLLDEPLPKDFDFPQSHDEKVPTIAGPRSMVEAAPGTISSEDLQAVQEGRKYFYIWGWAEYHDIFEGTKKRATRFCNQLIQVDGDTSLPASEHNPIQMMFGFHAENNYAD